MREHANQPVDWYPWGEEALSRARAEDKPIFLSIGYSACHWCHVMARESFSNPVIAQRLNNDFIPIKVDREERPDLDEIYVEAVRLMTGSAGWPLSVFLTPELKPFHGGTYFPPEPRLGLAGFGRVLEAVLHYYRTERHEIDAAANRVTAEIISLSTLHPYTSQLTDLPLRRFYEQRLEAFDSDHGGFGIAPKFPGPTELSLLLRLARRQGFDQALPRVELTLRKMADGGIYDQLGGGFHRYSTDTIWLVPHFEKMLYDNALLASVYAETWRLTRDDLYRRIAEETLGYVLRELKHPSGGFCSSQDAESSGNEGSYYTWTLSELAAATGPELAPLAASFYGVTSTGHYQGTNVLHIATPVEVLLRQHRLDLNSLWQRLAEIRSRLVSARNRRPHPRRDDKVLADWNGLLLSALAHCGRVFADANLLREARGLANYLITELAEDDELYHLRRPGLADVPGQLADYAFVGLGLLDLYEAVLEHRYLARALGFADRLIALFKADQGGFYTTRPDTPGLIARITAGTDGAIPAGNSAAVILLLRLGRLCGRPEFEREAEAALRRFYPLLEHYPSALSRMTAALDLLLNPGPEVVLFAPDESAESKAMLELLVQQPDEKRVTAILRATQPDTVNERLIPMTNGRYAIHNQPTAWVCHRGRCQEPVTTAAELGRLLDYEG